MASSVRSRSPFVALASTSRSVSRMRSTSRATAAPTGACEYVKPWTNGPAPRTVSWISAGRGHEAERPVAGGRALRRDEDVGAHAPVVEPEPAAGPAEAGHHLVGDEQDPVGPADLGDGRPVALGRLNGREGRPDDRFGDEGGDRVRLRRADQAVELRGELLGGPQRVRAGEAGTVRVRGRDVAEPAEPAFVRPPQRLAPRQVERAEAVAVVAPPPGDHDQAVPVAVREVVRAGQLERGLDRLRATGHRVDRGIVHRQVRADLGGVRLDGFGGERAAVGVGEASGLVRHRPGDLARGRAPR